MRPQLERSLRRAAPALVIAVFSLLLALPAVRDLERLFVGVGVIALAVAVVTGLYTFFDRPTERSHQARPDGG